MRITAIKQQIHHEGRYAIFVDDEYRLSVNAQTVLDSGIIPGQEIDEQGLSDLEAAAERDKLYDGCLRLLALRIRSEWEFDTYLKKKQASPALRKDILNTLREKRFIDDKRFAEAFVRDRLARRPSSRRKLTADLKQKHIATEIIEEVLHDEGDDELASLRQLVEKLRRTSRYQDDLKLMQYLSRQGFNYGNIKQVVKGSYQS